LQPWSGIHLIAPSPEEDFPVKKIVKHQRPSVCIPPLDLKQLDLEPRFKVEDEFNLIYGAGWEDMEWEWEDHE